MSFFPSGRPSKHKTILIGNLPTSLNMSSHEEYFDISRNEWIQPSYTVRKPHNSEAVFSEEMCWQLKRYKITVMHHLTTGICSENCVVRRFHRCENIIECTYTNLDSIAYCTPRLYCIAYCC